MVGSIAYVGSGSVSAFFFAYNLQSVFLSLIGATISVASFSTLTKAFADQDFEEYHKSLSHQQFWNKIGADLISNAKYNDYP